MLLQQFLNDDGGFILSTETVLLGTMVVLGMISGLAEIRNAVVQELGDYSQAVAWMSQSFAFTSVESTNAPGDLQTSGSSFSDSDDVQWSVSVAANGILVDAVSSPDEE